jgi:hypothetical protein
MPAIWLPKGWYLLLKRGLPRLRRGADMMSSSTTSSRTRVYVHPAAAPKRIRRSYGMGCASMVARVVMVLVPV